MKKYDYKDYQGMPVAIKEKIAGIIVEQEKKEKKEKDGIIYYEYKDSKTDEDILIEEEIVDIIISALYADATASIITGTEMWKSLFKEIMDKHYDEIKMIKVLKRLNKEQLKEFFVEFATQLKEHKVDFYQYFSAEELYQILSNEVLDLMRSNSGNIKRTEKLLSAFSILEPDLEEMVRKAGGLEKWATEKRKNNDYTIVSLLRKILEETEEQGKYVKLLIDIGMDITYISKFVMSGMIKKEDVIKLYKVPQLKKMIIEIMGKISISFVCVIFESIKDHKLLSRVKWKKIIDTKELQSVLDNELIKTSEMAHFIATMLEYGKQRLSEEDIDFIFESKKSNKSEMMRAYVILAQKGLYNEDKIIQLYREIVNENNQENPYQQQDEESVTVEELLAFFDTDKVIAKMEGYCNPNLKGQELEQANQDKEKFLTFYLGLLEAKGITEPEEKQQIISELEAKLEERIIKGDMTALIVTLELSEKTVINIKNMQAILREENQERFIELYNDNVIDDEMLLSLYKFGLIEGYIIDLIYQELDEEQLEEKMDNQSISVENIIILHCLGVIQQLGKRNLSGANWEQIAGVIEHEKLKSTLSLLYKNENIGFDDVNKLRELKVISAREADSILGQIDLDKIFWHGLTSEDGKGEAGRKKKREGVKRNEGIPIEDRNTHLKNLGFEPVVNVYGAPMVIARGSFAGYRVYVENAEKYGVIVFERETDGSSFAMHKAKAGEFIRQGVGETTLVGSRSDWREKSRTEGSVKARSHTLNWGRNIIETIVEISSEFKIDDDDERKKHVKDETKRLCDEHKDSIEYLRMVKEEGKVV